jgi:hypothetical protein
VRGSARLAPWPPYAAALWALIFAVFHVIWATGWYVGLDEEWARVAFAKPVFLAWDLVVAGLCALAVFVELALVRPWGRRVPRPFIVFCAWAGTGLLVFGTAFSLVRAIYLAAKSRVSVLDLGIWDSWFYLGAIVFSISTWQFCRPHRPVGAVDLAPGAGGHDQAR